MIMVVVRGAPWLALLFGRVVLDIGVACTKAACLAFAQRAVRVSLARRAKGLAISISYIIINRGQASHGCACFQQSGT